MVLQLQEMKLVISWLFNAPINNDIIVQWIGLLKSQPETMDFPMKSWQRECATLADDEEDQRDVNVAANNHCISLRFETNRHHL